VRGGCGAVFITAWVIGGGGKTVGGEEEIFYGSACGKAVGRELLLKVIQQVVHQGRGGKTRSGGKVMHTRGGRYKIGRCRHLFSYTNM